MIKIKITLLVMLLLISLVLNAENLIAVLERQLLESPIPRIQKIRLLVRLSELTQDSDPIKSMMYCKEALGLLEHSKEISLQIGALLPLIWASQNIGEYENALAYGNKAKKLAMDIKDEKLLATICNYLARIDFQLGFLDRSLASALQALRFSENTADRKSIAEAYKNIGNIYDQMKNSKLALTQYFKSLEILETLGDKKGIARMFNNIGNIYSSSHQYKKAMDYYRESLMNVEEINWKKGQVGALGNIAGIYSKTGNNRRSLALNLKALAIAKKIGQKRFIAILLSNIGVDYRLLGCYPKALEYVYQALALAKEIKNKDIVRNFYEELFYIYEAMKDYKQAFLFFKKYKVTNDEIFSKEAQKNISELLTRFDTEKKEKEIQWLTQHNRIQQLKLERQKLMRNFFLVLSLLILILSSVLYNRYRIKKKTEYRLKESEKKLRAMNIAKDKLFSIIAHDLGSPLNSILLSSGFLEKNYQIIDQEELREYLHQIYENSDQMAKLLENLLQWAVSQLGKLEVDLETLDLSKLTDETIELMALSARGKNIHLISNIHKNTLIHADKQMVGTILRNLLSNAVKYSKDGGEIKISSRSYQNFLEVEITDTGVGIPSDKLDTLFDLGVQNSTRGTGGERGIGLGLFLCKEFVEKNGGTIHVKSDQKGETSTNLPGTQVIFTLPIVNSSILSSTYRGAQGNVKAKITS